MEVGGLLEHVLPTLVSAHGFPFCGNQDKKVWEGLMQSGFVLAWSQV